MMDGEAPPALAAVILATRGERAGQQRRDQEWQPH
jgi:hypothetical protein